MLSFANLKLRQADEYCFLMMISHQIEVELEPINRLQVPLRIELSFTGVSDLNIRQLPIGASYLAFVLSNSNGLFGKETPVSYYFLP
jgi:hypothetical protein